MRKRNRPRLNDHINNEYIASIKSLRRSSPTLVYVEGFDDIAFWRTIFDEFENEPYNGNFEISTPSRDDMAKGKKVVLGFAKSAGENLILCVDSDFDYLLGNKSEQSRLVNENRYIVQTQIYAIENLLCLPTSLKSIAAQATKNDYDIFDFESFCADYSEALYPLFVWYFAAAKYSKTNMVTLAELKNVAKLNFLNPENNGRQTVQYVDRQVRKKVEQLEEKFAWFADSHSEAERVLHAKGVKASETHLWVQGHFWVDNVVKIILNTVCNILKSQMIEKIEESNQNNLNKRNTLSSYKNSLRDIDSMIYNNTQYRFTKYFEEIRRQIIEIIDGKNSNS